MEKKIGFIGFGKMAQAMAGGMISSGLISPDQIIASMRTEKTRLYVEKQYGIHTFSSNSDVAKAADVLFLAVAPYSYFEVIEEVKEFVKPDAIIVTIAAGITTEDVEHAFGKQMKVVRTMPNTPSLVGAGMTAVSVNDEITDDELQTVEELLGSFGKVEVIVESQMDAIPAISGSSPAYVYMMIEAMADGGVVQGLSRDQSYRLAAQAVLGAAQMVLETGKHPGELKDQVTSPGGATIAAVATLEQERFRGAVLAAMESCTEKVKKLGKK
ncbi:pyrroline-5-carboxylate reductase [Fictibacillus phosphorivorans]|uniref:Pyrroline-5-carboxylate reductase n=1 Tax=Fictibacillus phosphorivorans TaxID=1221500 RepID=A0A168WCD9_9BACL|nr:pyrroline-5-carboxylate reductase [Fictibacillus phosphorivorans]ANC79105.1 pyrroline-5-carboxylate reductase [Fictibacillus phosphorivorans]